MSVVKEGHKRIVVLISGSGTNLQALINATQSGMIKGDIVGVISNRKSAYGLTRAEAAGIPQKVVSYGPFKARSASRDAYDAHLASVVLEYQPDLIILAGFMRILGMNFLSCFPNQVVNLHPALPEAFPGTDAIARAWEAHRSGDLSETGVMVHFVVEEVDAGPVLGIRRLDLTRFETLEQVEKAMHVLEHELLVEVVSNLCTSKVNHSGSTL